MIKEISESGGLFMDRIHVNSSNIESIGYENSSQTLEISFINSGIYQYYGVPYDIYQGLMNADSHGRFLHQYIKNNFSYRKLY